MNIAKLLHTRQVNYPGLNMRGCTDSNSDINSHSSTKSLTYRSFKEASQTLLNTPLYMYACIGVTEQSVTKDLAQN